MVNRYCLSCHEAETKKGDLDLERFTSVNSAWSDPEIWTHILDQVSLGEMPPPEKRQPASDERKRLLAWIEKFLNEVAQSRAGDPGPVVLRRLNNAEYTYTLRDLTGLQSLEPASEFPADSAAGEGFMNTGNSLVMSPALFTKYLDAAKNLTDHIVLLPDGFRFSEKTTRRDWSEEILGQIRSLYARYTTAEGGEKVNLQGIVFNTNEGGRLPLEKYLEATIADRSKLQRGGDAFAQVAQERRLSAKYLRTLWNALHSSEANTLLGDVRARWRNATPDKAPELADRIGQWQNVLWKFSSVGHIGKLNGPKAWMEPADPFASKEELPPALSKQVDPAKKKELEAEFDILRQWFPAALCYPKIVPVDEVVTLTLAYREDHELKRLMLDDEESAQLDRLWEEYNFVSQNALLQVDAFEQLWQYATQDADPKVFEPMREPIRARAEAFRKLLLRSEPGQVEALVDFAANAYRRPLTSDEREDLRKLYQSLRAQEIPHGEAFRHVLAKVFVSPSFLYRLEQAPDSAATAPVTDSELATRLSYFLWSSLPDDQLRARATSGDLHEDSVLASQVDRMLKDDRIARLAKEFALAWLHIHDFKSLDEKSERHFPEFASLRAAMQTEAELFFTDLFQNDRSVLIIFEADHTFLNEPLAKHYGIEGVTGAEFRRVEGVKKHSRGGILTMAATLSKQSGASRTSPILRGTWLSEVILGEKLPKPPKGTPPLPEDAASESLTMREIVEKHTSDPRCANCHSRIDGYGFAMEGFDAIGRIRKEDAGTPVDTHSKLHDGTEVAGFDDLRRYLVSQRRDVVVQQFCRKLLGYALGRAVMLSDRPLIAEMQQALEANEYKFSAAVKTIVLSKQFREIRGKHLAALEPKKLN